MSFNIELKTSADGSSTLYRPDIDEHYHSINGAVQESMHVFIAAGLNYVTTNPIRILEVGFGTGLNAMLTFIHKPKVEVFYHGIEKYPVDSNLLSQTNYSEYCKSHNLNHLFDDLHAAPWNEESLIGSNFKLIKKQLDLLEFSATNVYNLVYFDAFAPEKQPELWTDDVFVLIFNAMCSKGILTTYCAKGGVRRSMQTAGFVVERIPGPPGKREMLRAVKP